MISYLFDTTCETFCISCASLSQNSIMASIPSVFLLFQFLLAHVTAAKLNQSHIIKLGSSLSPSSPTTSWPSPSGHFAFGFYRQGNGFAVGIWLVSQPGNTIVWTANRDDPPFSSNSTLLLTTQGKLLIRTGQGEEKAIYDGSLPAKSASMLDSGNFILHGNRSAPAVWESFLDPTDTLLGGQNLSRGHNLVSSMSKSDHSSGRFLLCMQFDNNLVAYPVNSSNSPNDAYWSIQFPSFDSHLTLDRNGNLSLTNTIQAMKLVNNSYSTEKRSVIYRATLDADGIFRLYSHHFLNNTTSTMSIAWVAFKDQCNTKGFCGLNSYCSSSGDKGDCYCFPGFVPIISSGKLLPCVQNITEPVCRKDIEVHYNMTSMENTKWYDLPYSVVPMAKENCSRSCQVDCNCGAALYDTGNCEKYKLPLRYGKRNSNISSTAFFKVIMGISIARNNYPVETVIEGKDNLFMILGMSLGSVAFFCFVLAALSFFRYWHQVDSYQKLSGNANLGSLEEFALRSFSYSELEKATNNFNQVLGRGSFGAIYRGTLNGGSRAIAVKRVEKVVEGEREFRAEMTAIGRTYHKNLVQLLGFCIDGSKKLLVYEYMSKGSLADILFKAETPPVWKERLRIALDVARGLFYLHEECAVHIIHCNIKPQNILIDDSWTAKISDFGLAKLLMRNQLSTAEGVSDSKGYSAPERQRNNLISAKADIYSYGVVLFEIICCRSNIEIKVQTEDEITLSGWVHKCFLGGELEKIVKDEDVDIESLERLVKVGLWCIQDDPILRPPMKEVILMLEGIMEVPLPPSPALSITM